MGLNFNPDRALGQGFYLNYRQNKDILFSLVRFSVLGTHCSPTLAATAVTRSCSPSGGGLLSHRHLLVLSNVWTVVSCVRNRKLLAESMTALARNSCVLDSAGPKAAVGEPSAHLWAWLPSPRPSLKVQVIPGARVRGASAGSLNQSLLQGR